MNREEFESILRELQGAEIDTSRTKGRTYAQGDEDALSNFKTAGEMIKCRCPECGAIYSVGPMVIAAAYMHKHFTSLLDYAARGKNLIESEPILGRVIDLRLYSALFAGLDREPKEIVELTTCWSCKRPFRRAHVMSVHRDDTTCASCQRLANIGKEEG